MKWPGLAAVVVSVVHVFRGTWAGSRRLDGLIVPFISAFLFNRGAHNDPYKLVANGGKSFQGCILLGKGFTFDDTDKTGAANPTADIQRLIDIDGRNAERIFRYIGGEEVNTSPTHAHRRCVINFEELTEVEARRWPSLMAIVEAKVKPERATKAADVAAWPWWQFWRTRPELQRSMAGLARVLVCSQTSKHRSFAFLPTPMVYDQKLVVFPLSGWQAFNVLSSRVHEGWALFFGSTLEDRPVYTPSDCFETFPFPPNWQSDPSLEVPGQAYYEFRAALLVRNDHGLTNTYNRFHDPGERDPEILRLRDLHAEMDRAVLAAYGWTDIATGCDFCLDYEIDDETWGEKKKPYRYRWPDAVRDEVLARLLDLNQKRYQEEVAAGLHGKLDQAALGAPQTPAAKAPSKTKKPRAKAKAKPNGTLALFGQDEENES